MTELPTRPRHLMLIAGEPSGDALGAQLMAAFKTLPGPPIRITGMGGSGMEAEGLTSLFSISDTSVMGLKEIAPKVPVILKRVRQLTEIAMADRPDAVVLIDSPAFTHRIAHRLKRLAPDIPVIKYVAPQVWASRPWRARQLAGKIDHLLTLLPFEPPRFQKHGISADFVGHPVLERKALMTGGADFRVRHGLGAETPLLLVLPGSRSNEIRVLMPVFRAAVARMAASCPGLTCCVATVPHMRDRIVEGTRDWPTHLIFADSSEDKFAAFDAADAALAASGTVTTELALAGTPMVVAYRVGWLTASIMRRLIITKYVTLINLVLDAPAVPELLQEKLTANGLAEAGLRLLTEAEAAEAQREAFRRALNAMGMNDLPASQRAAHSILSYLKRKHSKAGTAPILATPA